MRDTTENWYALAMWVITGCKSGQALEEFELLKNYREERNGSRYSKWGNRERMELIRSMRRGGKTWNEIGDVFGVKGSTVWHAFYNHGPKLFDDWDAGNE